MDRHVLRVSQIQRRGIRCHGLRSLHPFRPERTQRHYDSYAQQDEARRLWRGDWLGWNVRSNFMNSCRTVGVNGYNVPSIWHFREAVLRRICHRDLEGIVAKRRLAIYKDDGKPWLKIKNKKYSQAEGRHEMLTGQR